MRFENSNRLKQIDDFDLLPKLVKASLEHAVGSGFFAEASATSSLSGTIKHSTKR